MKNVNRIGYDSRWGGSVKRVLSKDVNRRLSFMLGCVLLTSSMGGVAHGFGKSGGGQWTEIVQLSNGQAFDLNSVEFKTTGNKKLFVKGTIAGLPKGAAVSVRGARAKAFIKDCMKAKTACVGLAAVTAGLAAKGYYELDGFITATALDGNWPDCQGAGSQRVLQVLNRTTPNPTYGTVWNVPCAVRSSNGEVVWWAVQPMNRIAEFFNQYNASLNNTYPQIGSVYEYGPFSYQGEQFQGVDVVRYIYKTPPTGGYTAADGTVIDVNELIESDLTEQDAIDIVEENLPALLLSTSPQTIADIFEPIDVNDIVDFDPAADPVPTLDSTVSDTDTDTETDGGEDEEYTYQDFGLDDNQGPECDPTLEDCEEKDLSDIPSSTINVLDYMDFDARWLPDQCPSHLFSVTGPHGTLRGESGPFCTIVQTFVGPMSNILAFILFMSIAVKGYNEA